jgi:hypothetical protein
VITASTSKTWNGNGRGKHAENGKKQPNDSAGLHNGKTKS